MKDQLEIQQLIEHLFRHESGKMVSVLTGVFGSENLILAEDIVQDTLIEAIKNWTYGGIPNNPTAWLYIVAKNKTLNALKREKYQKKYAFELGHLPESPAIFELDTDQLFSEEGISDDQLRMMFMCCHPSISKDSQIVLILKTLCGFNIVEIAKAFFSSTDTINKRLVRARKKIRQDKIAFEVPKKHELNNRLDAVLEAIYLLFNEGYSASSGELLIRYELCEEAIRLTQIMVNNPYVTHQTNVYALLSLMQLNASRFKAREDEAGNIFTLEEQNRSLWDFSLMEKGFKNLELSSQQGEVSIYHILASISSYYCSAKDFRSTDWKSILELYDKLLLINNTPIIILNRAIILSKVHTVETAIRELERIKNEKTMQSNYLFYATKTELYIQLKNYAIARESLKKAIALAPLPTEKRMLQNRFKKYFDKKRNTNVPMT